MIDAEFIEDESFDEPAYTLADASRYADVPYQTVRYWALGRDRIPPIIELAETSPPALSFANLLECHVLNAMRSRYRLHLPQVRLATMHLKRTNQNRHPLLRDDFRTNGIDLFIDEGALINLSKGGQSAFREILDLYLERITTNDGILKFYPFVAFTTPTEPKIISITPKIAFGRSVIDGTGIATAVIAARFGARDSMEDLAREYRRSEREIEEAIRWEGSYRTTAAATA
jgi:uncharacterized protein (DUF433 family)